MTVLRQNEAQQILLVEQKTYHAQQPDDADRGKLRHIESGPVFLVRMRVRHDCNLFQGVRELRRAATWLSQIQ